MNTQMEELESRLNQLLANPNEWKADKCNIRHRKTGIQLWISNGVEFLSIDAPYQVDFPRDMAERLWIKVAPICERQPVRVDKILRRLDRKWYEFWK